MSDGDHGHGEHHCHLKEAGLGVSLRRSGDAFVHVDAPRLMECRGGEVW